MALGLVWDKTNNAHKEIKHKLTTTETESNWTENLEFYGHRIYYTVGIIFQDSKCVFLFLIDII